MPMVFVRGIGFVLLATQSRTIWLPWIAQSLIVEDRLRTADLIAVFSAKEERVRHAARLYRERLSPRIFVTGGLTVKGIDLFCHQRVTGAELTGKIPVSAINEGWFLGNL